MILPSKHISEGRALLTIGAKLLEHLDSPKTVSAVWEDIRVLQAPISFDWFVLALDLLYAIDTIEIRDGLLIRRTLG